MVAASVTVVMAVTMQNAGALTTSDTVTITYNVNAATNRATLIQEFSGVASATFDVSGGRSAPGATTNPFVTAAAPSTVGDLAVAAFTVVSTGACTLNGTNTVGVYSPYTTAALVDGTFQVIGCYQTNCSGVAQESSLTTPSAITTAVLVLLKAAVQVSSSDTAIGTDTNTSLHIASTSSEAAVSTESNTLTTALSNADAVTGLEGTPKIAQTSTDAVTGLDTSSLSTALTSTDTATVNESSPVVALSSTDTEVTQESSVVNVALASSDIGASIDTGNIKLSSADAATSSDSINLQVSVASTDTGISSDGSTIVISSSDSISASEAATLHISLGSSDAVSSAEGNAPLGVVLQRTISQLTIPAGTVIELFAVSQNSARSSYISFSGLPNSGGLVMVNDPDGYGPYFPVDSAPFISSVAIYLKNTLAADLTFIVRILPA